MRCSGATACEEPPATGARPDPADWIRLARTRLAVGETVILLHPPPHLVGVSIVMERIRQQNDSLADGYTRPACWIPRTVSSTLRRPAARRLCSRRRWLSCALSLHCHCMYCHNLRQSCLMSSDVICNCTSNHLLMSFLDPLTGLAPSAP